MLSSSSLRPRAPSPTAQPVVRQEPAVQSVASWLALLMTDAPHQLQAAVDECLGNAPGDPRTRARRLLTVLTKQMIPEDFSQPSLKEKLDECGVSAIGKCLETQLSFLNNPPIGFNIDFQGAADTFCRLMVEAPHELPAAVDAFLATPVGGFAPYKAAIHLAATLFLLLTKKHFSTSAGLLRFDKITVLEPYDLQELGCIVSRALRQIAAASEGAPSGAATAAAAQTSQGHLPPQPRHRAAASAAPQVPLLPTSFFESFVTLQGGIKDVPDPTSDVGASAGVEDALPGTSGLPACLRCYESRQPLEEGAVLCRDGWMRNRAAVRDLDADNVAGPCRTTVHLVSLWKAHAASDPKALDDALHKLLRCPLTQDRFESPVLASDGNTYEHKDIEAFQKDLPGGHVQSPVSRQPFANDQLFYNFNLVELIVWLRRDPNFPSFTDDEPRFVLPASAVLVPMRSAQGMVVSDSDRQLSNQVRADLEDMEYFSVIMESQLSDPQYEAYKEVRRVKARSIQDNVDEALGDYFYCDVMSMTFLFAEAEANRLMGCAPVKIIPLFERLAEFGDKIDQGPICARLALLYLACTPTLRELEIGKSMAERALQMNPRSAHALCAMGEYFRHVGRGIEAKDHLWKSMVIVPLHEAVRGLQLLAENPFELY
jgi:hypothetical protein